MHVKVLSVQTKRMTLLYPQWKMQHFKIVSVLNNLLGLSKGVFGRIDKQPFRCFGWRSRLPTLSSKLASDDMK